MNETLDLINNRVSLRSYAHRPIEPEHVDALLNSAIRAPTAGNMMLYSILQIDDPIKKMGLAETCGHSFIADAPLALLFLADMQRWHDYYQAFDVPRYCEREGLSFREPDIGKLMMACRCPDRSSEYGHRRRISWNRILLHRRHHGAQRRASRLVRASGLDVPDYAPLLWILS